MTNYKARPKNAKKDTKKPFLKPTPKITPKPLPNKVVKVVKDVALEKNNFNETKIEPVSSAKQFSLANLKDLESKPEFDLNKNNYDEISNKSSGGRWVFGISLIIIIIICILFGIFFYY